MNRTVKRYFPIFVLPTLIAFIIAFAVPFVMGLVLSFTEFRTVTDATFVGFSNYARAFTDERKTDNGNAIRYERVRGIYPKRGGGRAGYFPVVYIKA
jgi:ABC-type sugar transport system permease subunit